MNPSTELWVLTYETDTSDPIWGYRTTVVGTPEPVNAVVDLSNGVPFGWRLFKGNQARRWLRDSLKEELRYQRDKQGREKAGGN